MLRGRVNGTEIPGPFTLDEFAEALAEPTLSGASLARVVVHSLFGHGPEEVGEFIARTEPDRLTWWVHDYSAQCANPNLLRNGVHWCASPSLEAQCCELCAFGPHRTEHVRRVHDLLQAFDWDVVAPSQSAAESSAAGHVVLPRPVRVEPHGRLVTGDGCRMREADAPFRVAFVGHPAVAKGWMEFLRLVDELADEEIEFVHFGADNTLTEGVRFVETRQGHANFGVVTEFLSANRIDAVLNWARWRETFNFVTYEAMAAGCLIITNESSGNVVAAARQFDMALVFDSFEDVVAPGALIRALRRKLADGPPSTGRLEMTGLSAATRGNP